MRLKYIGTNFKSYATLCGSLRFNRAILRPETDEDLKRFQALVGEGRTTYHPMDSLLGVEKIPFLISAGLLSSTVCGLLEAPGGEDSSLSQPDRMIVYAGECAYKNQLKEAEMAGIATAERRCGRLFLYMGSTFRNVYTDRESEAASERIACRYAVALREDDIEYLRDRAGEIRGYRPSHRDMTAVLEDEDNIHRHIRALALRNGYCAGTDESATRIVVLSDGSEWIEKTIRQTFAPDTEMTLILDRERLMDDAEGYLRFHLPNRTRAEEHIRRLNEALDSGDRVGALKLLEPYRFAKRPAGVRDVYGIIKENINNINYGEYRDRGIYMGTGIKDCSDRRLSDLPERLTGGVSLKESARGLLSLIALKESERWDELIPMLENGC